MSRDRPWAVAAAYAAAVFIWLNAALIRAPHYLAGTPLHHEGIVHSTQVLWLVLITGAGGWRCISSSGSGRSRRTNNQGQMASAVR